MTIEDMQEFHEDLRNYANIEDRDKPIVVAGILLALSANLKEKDFNDRKKDGEVVFSFIQKATSDKIILNEMRRVFVEDATMNEVNEYINGTPCKVFTTFIDKLGKISGDKDYLGEFYNEFISYSGGEGQNLGIILTPDYIAKLCVKLADIKENDILLDPCMGTGRFLIEGGDCDVLGIEMRKYMYTLAVTNMILRGKKNFKFANGNCMTTDIGKATVGITNPPYSQGSSKSPELYEACFIQRLLDMLEIGSTCIVVVPPSTFTTSDIIKVEIRNRLLAKNTLEGVISLNKDAFFRVGTMPCIAIFRAGIPHDFRNTVKFINFEDDGCIIENGRRIPTEETWKKIDEVVKAWNGKESPIKIEERISLAKEWLYSSYHTETYPQDYVMEEYVVDYLTFRCKSIMSGRGYLFSEPPRISTGNYSLNDREWKKINLEKLFEVKGSKKRKFIAGGDYPYVSAKANDNGHYGYSAVCTEKPKCITVESAIKGYSYYQEFPFTTLDHVEQLIPKFDIDLFTGLFFAGMLTFIHKRKYHYGYKASKARLKEEYIYVPVDDNGDVDFEFIRKYIAYIYYSKSAQVIKNLRLV